MSFVCCFMDHYFSNGPLNLGTHRWEVSVLVGSVRDLDLLTLWRQVAVTTLNHLAVVTKLKKIFIERGRLDSPNQTKPNQTGRDGY